MSNIIKPIPDWYKKQNICWFCGSDKSVKYELSSMELDFPICNACMIKLATRLWESKSTNT